MRGDVTSTCTGGRLSVPPRSPSLRSLPGETASRGTPSLSCHRCESYQHLRFRPSKQPKPRPVLLGLGGPATQHWQRLQTPSGGFQTGCRWARQRPRRYPRPVETNKRRKSKGPAEKEGHNKQGLASGLREPARKRRPCAAILRGPQLLLQTNISICSRRPALPPWGRSCSYYGTNS